MLLDALQLVVYALGFGNLAKCYNISLWEEGVADGQVLQYIIVGRGCGMYQRGV